jgi:uncharacterized protein YjdB
MVATVNSSGKVRALSAGTTTVTVTTADGSRTASCTVTVNNPVDYSWIRIATFIYEVKGDKLRIEIVGARAAEFTTLYANGQQIGSFADGKAEIPLQNELHLKAVAADGTPLEAWYKK